MVAGSAAGLSAQNGADRESGAYTDRDSHKDAFFRWMRLSNNPRTFDVPSPIDMNEIPLFTKKDALTTYIADQVCSVRFGAASSHGKANMM